MVTVDGFCRGHYCQEFMWTKDHVYRRDLGRKHQSEAASCWLLPVAKGRTFGSQSEQNRTVIFPGGGEEKRRRGTLQGTI